MRWRILFAVLLLTQAIQKQLPGQWKEIYGLKVPQQSAMYDEVPNSRRVSDASKTTLPYRLDSDARSVRLAERPQDVALILPARARLGKPKLAAVLRRGPSIEVFLIWTAPHVKPDALFESHIEIFDGTTGGRANSVHELKLSGGPGVRLSLFESPDDRNDSTVLADVDGGAYWGTTYVISPDRTAIQKIADGSDHEFADLDRSGKYEFISWNRRPDDIRCLNPVFFTRFYPEVFVRSGWQFRKIWPPAQWSGPGDHTSLARKSRVPGDGSSPAIQVVGGFADLDGDGRAELICLRDRYQLRPEQELAIYRLSEGAFHLVASAPLGGDHLAYMLSGVDKSSREPEITVFQTTRDRCEADGWQPETGEQWLTRYVYRQGELKLLQR
jgi:hypothetical protein